MKNCSKEEKYKPFVGEDSQECVRCNKILPFENFAKHAKTKSGYNSWCKPCFNEYRRKRRAEFKN